MMQGPLDFTIVAQTQDDAIGEAFDKVGRLLHLDYPAGPNIDRLAQRGEVTYPLPHLKLDSSSFSYSGIKSHFNNLIHNATQKNETIHVENMCASFQSVAISQLISRLDQAIQTYQPRHVIVAGGVSANTFLRQQCEAMMNQYPHIQLSIPPLQYCTDNAAMIGAAAYHYYQAGLFTDLSVKVNPGLRLRSEIIV
jgi:N6-L-threonylcarbamoyladenine synthase